MKFTAVPVVALAVAVLSAMPQLAAAQDAVDVSGGPAAALAAVPNCAKPCLLGALGVSGCSPLNETCICTSHKFEEEATRCIFASCKVKEVLRTKNITMAACKAPIRDRGDLYNTINITFGTITGAFFLMRMYFKLVISRTEFWLDDWFIIATFFTAIPSTIMNTHGLVANGLGRDIWTLDYETITNFIKFFYIMEIMYFTHLPFLKMSMLLFYLRIFPYERVRKVLWVSVGFNGIVGIIFLFIAIFQCDPISYYWTMWDNDHVGRCMNINAVGWANAAVSIAFDLWMLAVPLSQLPKLRMHWKKKLGIALMFCVGTFVTVVSMLRLQSLVTFSNSTNPTWDQWDVANWSTLEINVGIICACLPALKGILVRHFPKILGGSSAGSRRGTEGYNNIVLGARNVRVANASGGSVSASASRPGDYYPSSSDDVTTNTVEMAKDEKVIITSRSYRIDHEEEGRRIDTNLPIMGRSVQVSVGGYGDGVQDRMK